tara:strand:- start:584 stop:946 length:363 start_codon:yes stop_codon:yes gene_type:complete
MATLNARSYIEAKNLTSQVDFLVDYTKQMTVTQGGIVRENITAIVGGPATLLTAAEYAKGTKVYLKNSGALDLFFRFGGSGAEIKLLAGEWALFPWFANVDLKVYASANTGCLVEYGAFQ